MIGLLFSISPFILMIIYFVSFKKRKDISWEIENGTICCSCKEHIHYPDNSIVIIDKVNTCVSCRREESIGVLFGKKNKFILKLRDLIVSKKFRRIQFIFIGLILAATVVNIVLLFTLGIKTGYIMDIINFTYWVSMITRQRLTTVKHNKIKPPPWSK